MNEVNLTSEYGFSLLELQANMKDRKWRLNNLYYVRDATGKKVKFVMNPVQEYIHDNLWFNTIIPKARQLGVTTFFTILYFDQILFSDNKMATIIAHRQEDMKKIFKDKIKFAWDNLHPWLKFMIGEPDTNNANELSFPNGSTINTALSTRSGTVQFLHCSEFAYICQKFPERAQEIVTGALNSVHAGNMVSIESTSAGMEGYFYEFCQKAEELRLAGTELTQMDWKIMFFPWWIDKKYVLSGKFALSDEDAKYFELLEQKHKIKLTDEQKRWYVKKKETQKDEMFKEFPSTLEECFKTIVEGSYYGKWMSKAYLGQRIAKFDADPQRKVDTYWDLGINDTCVILFVQQVGWRINFVDVYSGSGEGLAHYVKEIEERYKKNGWRMGKHVFPWDVESKDIGSGLTRKETLIAMGLTNIHVAPKLGVADGIEKVRGLFNRFFFDELKCQKLIAALTNYRKEWDDKAGVWKDKPKHDENSHWADPIRVLATTWIDDEYSGANEYDNELRTEQRNAAGVSMF